MELLKETWTKRFGFSTTRRHDPRDALFGYDTMWLGALALDLAEERLQNMTPSLTLGDFKYTGENSTIIKNAIYSSALEVTFTGASVRVTVNGQHMNLMQLMVHTFFTVLQYNTTCRSDIMILILILISININININIIDNNVKSDNVLR